VFVLICEIIEYGFKIFSQIESFKWNPEVLCYFSRIIAMLLSMIVDNHEYTRAVASGFEEQSGSGRTIYASADSYEYFFTFYVVV
jgi:hypothetical protein